MASSDKAQDLLASGFFNDRILVEIEAFDPGFFFGVSPKRTRVKHRHLGHFMFTTGIVVHGRIIAPKEMRGLPARIWMTPMSPELLSGHGRFKNVGRFGINPDNPDETFDNDRLDILSSNFTDPTEPVMFTFSCVPYPTTTTSPSVVMSATI